MDSIYGTMDPANFSASQAFVEGHIFAIVVLRALCAERALKLVKLLERDGNYRNIHDLWCLYEDLQENSKKSIGMGKYLTRRELEKVFQDNRNNFNDWRYPFEQDGALSTQFNHMKNATRQLIEWSEDELRK